MRTLRSMSTYPIIVVFGVDWRPEIAAMHEPRELPTVFEL